MNFGFHREMPTRPWPKPPVDPMLVQQQQKAEKARQAKPGTGGSMSGARGGNSTRPPGVSTAPIKRSSMSTPAVPEALARINQLKSKATMSQNRSSGRQAAPVVTEPDYETSEMVSALEQRTEQMEQTCADLQETMQGAVDMISKLQTQLDESDKKIQDLHAQSYWAYAKVLADQSQAFIEADTSKAQNPEPLHTFAKGTTVLVFYPMEETDNAVWMKTRWLDNDGQFDEGWIKVFDSATKTAFVGEFSLTST